MEDMAKKTLPDAPHADWALIEALGGPPEVVRLLKLTKPGSLQRVHNWKVRGIPSKVMLENQALFKKAARALAEV